MAEFVGLAVHGTLLAVHVTGHAVLKIKHAADTAKQNKPECDLLALRLSMIEEVLLTLPQDKLRSTLQEAHDLVIACQKRGSVKKFFRASSHADRFREVNASITADLRLFPLAIYTDITSRFDMIGSSSSSP